MSFNDRTTSRPSDLLPFVQGEWIAVAVLGLAALAYGVFTLAPSIVFACALLVGGALAVVAILRHPIFVVGLFLAIIPAQYMAVEVPRFFGVQHMTLISGAVDSTLLLATLALWWKNGFRPTAADWFLFGFIGLGAIYVLFGATVADIKDDFMWLLPYAAGRVAFLGTARERVWAKRAVWVAAVFSLIGMVEVLFIGPGPRTLLYTTLTDERTLSASAWAQGFGGLREASTMSSPLFFGAMCMVALVIWWAYSCQPVPGVIIAAGLVLSVTRSAWVAVVLAFSLLAIRMKRKKLLFGIGAAVLVVIVALGPLLGFKTNYWQGAVSKKNSSTQTHYHSISAGLTYIRDNPFGSGVGKTGWRAAQTNAAAPIYESTYLQLTAEYGFAGLLFFLGFLSCAFYLAWRSRLTIGNTAAGVVLGFGLMMIVLIMHSDFPVACWVWFPIGLAIGRTRPGPKWVARAIKAGAGLKVRSA